MRDLKQCPVCLGVNGGTASIRSAGNWYVVDCQICGEFQITHDAYERYLNPTIETRCHLSQTQRNLIAHKIRTSPSEFGENRPAIMNEIMDGFLEQGITGPNPAQQATNAIRFIGDEITRTGERLDTLPNYFFVEIGSPTPAFAAGLMHELKKRDDLDGDPYESHEKIETLCKIKLTLNGWEKYERERTGLSAGRYGFLAMEFNDPVLETLAREVIKPLLKKEIRYDVIDVRDVAKAGIIDNIMRAQIRDSAFVLADLTHGNNGAYWEAGYAEGLGKPVIYLCERKKFDNEKPHFDTNHCTTVIWCEDTIDEFKKQLVATVRRSLNLF